MRMMLQSLVPGMEHAEEADLGAKVSRVAYDLNESGCTGAEQQSIKQPLVLKRERSQFTRQGEHGMHVARGQQLAFALSKPADAGVALALRAVPVTTRNGARSITCLMVSNFLWRVASRERAIYWDSEDTLYRVNSP
jgi:hypothetical protein